MVQKMNAIIDDIMRTGVIGLDAEWDVNKNAMGLKRKRSKTQMIQIAYRDAKSKVHVIIFRTGKLSVLPLPLEQLLGNNDVIIAGSKVSGDLGHIGKDFNIDTLNIVDQKSRSNVCNLGLYARRRDVVQNAAACSLELLAEKLLSVKMDKSLHKGTDWTKWTNNKEKYCAADASISLEAYEELTKLPDLSRRCTIEDIAPGKRFDMAPMLSGSMGAAAMATRAASVTVLDMLPLDCPTDAVQTVNSTIAPIATPSANPTVTPTAAAIAIPKVLSQQRGTVQRVKESNYGRD